MSVRELSGAYNGLRVQRTIDGETQLKHFSLRIPSHKNGATTWHMAEGAERAAIEKKAQAYDKKLEALQKAAKNKSKKWDPVSTRTNTGVRGVAYRYGRDSQGYIIEGFWISVYYNKKQHSAMVRLANRTWREAWVQVVGHLTKKLKLSAAESAVIARMMPSESIRDKSEAN